MSSAGLPPNAAVGFLYRVPDLQSRSADRLAAIGSDR
jgi:hypothetical protein